MIKINFHILLFFTLFSNNLIYSQKIEDINFNYNKSTKKVDIDYKISGLKSNLYNVNFKPFYSSGKSIFVNSFNADLTNIKRGLHSIVWDPKNDGIQIDGDVYLTMYLNTKINVSVQKHLLKSIVYPGFGDYQLRNKKYYFLYGLAAYGLLGTSIYFNNQASVNYNSYLLSMNFDESQGLYNDYQTNNRMSKIFAFSSAFIWTVDLVSILKRGNKVKEDLTVSDYYNKLSKKEQIFNSKTKYINTKEDYYIAYEKAEKYYKASDYKKAKEYLNRIDNLNPSKEIILKKNTLIKKVNYELKKLKDLFNSLVSQGDDLFNQKNYEKAKLKYEQAYKLEQSYLVKKKIAKCTNLIKVGFDFFDDKYVEVYNKDGLKLEVKFSFGGCKVKSNMYFYRYDGYLSSSKKYLNWKVDYKDCDNNKRTYQRGIPIGGPEIIQQIGKRPEDIETDGFDDVFPGFIINKIYDFKVSNYEIRRND